MNRFFTFRQNNSGGSFDRETGITVIIEAANADEANQIAETKGIYFNGVAAGMDCECCGDRWSKQWSDEVGADAPEVYREAAIEDGSVRIHRKE